MSWSKPRRWWLALLLGLLAIGPEPLSGQQKPIEWIPPTSMSDPRLEVFRQAGQRWESRTGPRREVIDQVCLVPDLPTFFEAISTWDESHYFPILLDDVESSFRFIRAFKPARIVRMPQSAAPVPANQIWEKAVEAVGASWTSVKGPGQARPRGDSVPRDLGATPPAVVFSSPDAPMLAGAVALAAGHFQPLLRLDFSKKFNENLTFVEAQEFAASLTRSVEKLMPNYLALNDDCDFLTIAGDWPYSYTGDDGLPASLEDRLGRRTTNPPHRWAWAGRLIGDSKQSLYRAMCSLFLQPESALMFNTYDESSPPWSDFTMRPAASKLNSVIRTTHVSGPKDANVSGWYETFNPSNRYGLVLINSHGSGGVFALQGGGTGSTSDIPVSCPTAVLMIHSFSAVKPNDPETIAGRWLANGAFLYFGSMHEPYLQSFRLPRLVGEMIGERLPFVVAVRTTMTEFGGQPWRQVFLGDPLYAIKPEADRKAPRRASWAPTASWSAYVEPTRPTTGTDSEKFLWSFKTSLARLQGKPAKGTDGDDLIETLLSIKRDKLPSDFRPIDDALTTDVLFQARKRAALKNRLMSIPKNERTPAIIRALEAILGIDLNIAINRKDAATARTLWREVMKLEGAREFKERVIARVGQLADTPIRRHDWMTLLRSALRERPKLPETEVLTTELKRVEELSKDDQ